jgi:hypothetical protein
MFRILVSRLEEGIVEDPYLMDKMCSGHTFKTDAEFFNKVTLLSSMAEVKQTIAASIKVR